MISLFQQHKLWPDVVHTVSALESAGFQAVLAGGCVRDALLHRPWQDFDVATSALPHEVEKIFAPHTIAVGKAFGVISVITQHGVIEVATFRTDGDYKDGRHPESVTFSSLKEDAQRRDFTINALYYSLSENKIIDLVEGQKDLKEKKLRAVGDPLIRFKEDYLRPLRAVRLAAQLNFTIENKTWQAILSVAQQVGRVAVERRTQELRKIANSDGAQKGFELLLHSGLLKICLHGWAQCYSEHSSAQDLWDFLWLALSRLARPLPLPIVLSWLAWGFKVSSSQLEEWFLSLKLTRDEMRQGLYLLKDLETLLDPATRLGERILVLGQQNKLALQDQKGDLSWQEFILLWSYAGDLKQNQGPVAEVINITKKHLQQILGLDGKLPSPLVGGQDLISRGLSPGAQLGKLLKECYFRQLEQNFKSQEEVLGSVTK